MYLLFTFQLTPCPSLEREGCLSANRSTNSGYTNKYEYSIILLLKNSVFLFFINLFPPGHPSMEERGRG
jgi:hypothetical protein